MRPLADREFVDLSRYPCVRQEALHRIRILLDEEVRAGVSPDMRRYMTIASAAGETLLEIPFCDALSPRNMHH